MKITVMTGLLTEWEMNINAGHVVYELRMVTNLRIVRITIGYKLGLVVIYSRKY